MAFMDSADLRIETITTIEGLRALGEDWSALSQRAHNDLPFLLHEWMVTWWEHFQKHERLLEDSLHTLAVRRASGELVAVAPMMRTERPARGPVRIRALNFLGADPYITELRHVLVDPSCELAVGSALVTALERRDDWDWVQWAGLVQGSPLCAAIERSTRIEWGGSLPAHVLPLAPSWEEFKRGLKRNIKESIRHGYNSLKRDGKAIHFEVAEKPEEIARRMGDFYRLHGMRAELADTTIHANRFAWPEARRFLDDVICRLAEAGSVRVFSALSGDTVIAMRIGFVLPNCLYLYYSGYDPAWRAYGIMTTVVAEAIQYAIAKGFGAVHLSTGTDLSKTRWGTVETSFYDGTMVRNHPLSRAAYKAYRLAFDARKNDLLRRILPYRELG